MRVLVSGIGQARTYLLASVVIESKEHWRL